MADDNEEAWRNRPRAFRFGYRLSQVLAGAVLGLILVGLWKLYT